MFRARYEKVRNDPAAVRDLYNDPEVRQALTRAAAASPAVAWWSLVGVTLSMLAVVFGSLVGSGDVPVPVPILGVRKPVAHDPRGT